MLQEQGTFHSCRVTDQQTDRQGRTEGGRGPGSIRPGGQGEAWCSGACVCAGGQIVPCQATRQPCQHPGAWLPLKKGSDPPTKTKTKTSCPTADWELPTVSSRRTAGPCSSFPPDVSAPPLRGLTLRPVLKGAGAAFTPVLSLPVHVGVCHAAGVNAAEATT